MWWKKLGDNDISWFVTFVKIFQCCKACILLKVHYYYKQINSNFNFNVVE